MKDAKPVIIRRLPPLLVKVCHGCGTEWATYGSTLPKRWVRNPNGTLSCPRCRP